MKLDKNKKRFIIGIGLLVVGSLIYNITYSKTDKNIDLAIGNINNKTANFQIMAMYKNDGNEDISISEVPSSGYTLNTEKSICKVDGEKDNNITIEYINGKINFRNVTKNKTKCYLYFNKIVEITVDNILAGLNAKTDTPDFSKIADTDEGVYQTNDGTNMYSGTTYYWRGAVKNNYVKFANFCWRIIRINGDKTIRLIYDGTTCHANGTTGEVALTSKAYNTSRNQSNYVGWTYEGVSQRPINNATATVSNAKSQTENWYKTNITDKGFDGKVANGKFCNDRNAQSGNTWAINGNTFYYAAYKRTLTDYSPTFNCANSGDVYTLKVGAVTADEVEFAGGKNENSTSYYLYNGQRYWTMSPSNWDSGYAYVLAVDSYGFLLNWNVDDSNIGFRPVINLNSDVTFSSGDGTKDLPYTVAN